MISATFLLRQHRIDVTSGWCRITDPDSIRSMRKAVKKNKKQQNPKNLFHQSPSLLFDPHLPLRLFENQKIGYVADGDRAIRFSCLFCLFNHQPQAIFR